MPSASHRALPEISHVDLLALEQEGAAEYVRMVLKARYGLLRRAFKEMDPRGKGSLTIAEFRSGLELAGIVWPDDEDAACDFKSLFATFSADGSKTMTVSDLMGPESAHVNFDNHQPHHHSHNHHHHKNHNNHNVHGNHVDHGQDWVYMTTMEKWHVWCEDTATPEDLHGGDVARRPPHWEPTEGDSRNKTKREKQMDVSHARMRRMLAQGTHKTRDGLKLTAWHLPAELDSETIQKYRRNALDEINQQSHRIREAIVQTTQQRRSLHGVREQLEELERQANADRLKEIHEKAALARGSKEQCGLQGGLRGALALNLDAVNMMKEDNLPFQERQARELARELGVSTADIEVVQSVYDRFDPDGKGITRGIFPKMLAELLEIREKDMSSQKLEELWRVLNTDGDGRISFTEYVTWHFQSCGSMSVLEKRSDDQQPEGVAVRANRQAARRVTWQRSTTLGLG